MREDIDEDKVDQAVLALLSLGRHEGYRTWKAFDWEVMSRLHQKGYISDPCLTSKELRVRWWAKFDSSGVMRKENRDCW